MANTPPVKHENNELAMENLKLDLSNIFSLKRTIEGSFFFQAYKHF